MRPALVLCAALLSAASLQAQKGAWTLGIYMGPSPFQLAPPPEVKNPVLTGADVTDDPAVDTLAHPFMVVKNSVFYLFFTAKDIRNDAGGIGLAESPNGVEWKYKRIVLREPFVLAHPFVFEWKGSYYMIPENHSEPSVRLYRAAEFPNVWKFERELLKGDTYISPTLVRHREMWWMFVSPQGNTALRLFYAHNLEGPWTEHPRSPIVKDDRRTARPAGRPFLLDGSLYRLGQDCYPNYGHQVRAFRITEISPAAYAETLVETPLVKASSQGWNAQAMHHVDAHQVAKGRWVAAVDALGRPE